MISIVLFVLLCTIGHFEGFSIHRDKRNPNNDPMDDRINLMGSLTFSDIPVPKAKKHRKIPCLFVFDKEASANLLNSEIYGKKYADRLAFLASKYTAHANIKIINAGIEMWINTDRISFTVGQNPYSPLPDFVTEFQTYLRKTYSADFGTKYAVGVLLSNKNSVAGGFSQGPPCTTDAVSMIRFKPYPWNIGGLLAHELAHTLSAVHTFELQYLCPDFPSFSFCKDQNLLNQCQCEPDPLQPGKCLMTYEFGKANVTAPVYTPCDIEVMNYFAENATCLYK